MSTVTQADRERAASLYEHFPMLASSRSAADKTRQSILDGNCDDWTTVQSFAAHRTSSQVELLEALDVLIAIDDMWSECDGERVNPDEARSPIVRDIWHRARETISNARSNSMVSGRVS